MTRGPRRARRGRTPAGTGWFLVGYVGVGGFFALEVAARERGTASSLDASQGDQGTTHLIVAAYMLAGALAPALRLVPLPRLPRAAAVVGLGFEVAGLMARTWSMRTLRGAYTRTLRVEGKQEVIDTGPYRLVRHPGYAGSLLTWTGFALTSRSLPVAAVVAGLLGWAYHRRITTEEYLLRRDLPGYDAYRYRTKRLVPFVW